MVSKEIDHTAVLHMSLKLTPTFKVFFRHAFAGNWKASSEESGSV